MSLAQAVHNEIAQMLLLMIQRGTHSGNAVKFANIIMFLAHVFAVAQIFHCTLTESRRSLTQEYYVLLARTRLWFDHFHMGRVLISDDISFKRSFRMTRASFDKLVSTLHSV